MHRRSILVLVGTVALAGCNGLDGEGDTLVDETLATEQNTQFSASEGDEVALTVEATSVESDDPGDGVETESLTITISHDGTPQYSETVSDGERLEAELTLDADGGYNVVVAGGEADVTIKQL